MGLGDPIVSGLIASYQRPGGNVTGIDNGNAQNDAAKMKMIALAKEMIPNLTH